MVDTLVSKTSVERRAGSSPVRGTDCSPMVSGEWVDINTEKVHHHEGESLTKPTWGWYRAHNNTTPITFKILIMKKKEKFDIESFVYDYPTKNKQGFTSAEMKDIVKKFPFEINEKKFQEAMWGNTCMIIDGEMITYHCDLVTAFRCGLENRDMEWWEWD